MSLYHGYGCRVLSAVIVVAVSCRYGAPKLIDSAIEATRPDHNSFICDKGQQVVRS